MLGTLRKSTPIDLELKTPTIPKMDALNVVLVDLPNEIKVIGLSKPPTTTTLVT